MWYDLTYEKSNHVQQKGHSEEPEDVLELLQQESTITSCVIIRDTFSVTLMFTYHE